ncbi:MAG TPA: transposase [Candidatus Acidoferrum sp.]|nr:transposase [Candidatus Acidoferrum sp.]
MAESPKDISGHGLEELKALLVQALAEVARLKAENAELREEIARLKGLKGRPKLKPSGMEKAAEAGAAKGSRRKGRRGAKRAKLVLDEAKIVKPDSLPKGARLKGYEDFIVQDIVIKPWTVLYRRERWLLPSGETVVAALPKGVTSHFGPELKRFILSQYHQGQITIPRLLTQLQDLGIDISKRQIVRLLSARQDAFLAEAKEVLRTGLRSASWFTVDDTGARHKAKNGFCTHIGNDRFAFFATTFSKSRLNFLELLRAGQDGYVINEAALAYMREHKLPQATIARFGSAKRRFAGRKAFMAYLRKLGLTGLEVKPDPVQIATEGALWGSIAEQGLLDGTVIVSDGAGQFKIAEHALCWVHAERLIHKLDTFCEAHVQAKERIRTRIWRFYKALKDYRQAPAARRAARLARRFDAIFSTETGFVTLDRLLARLRAQKDDLLAVLKHPEIPLHTNGSENDIRCQVTRRKISSGTRSDPGRDCRDAFLGLMKTCAKHAISFWDYLGDRLGVPDAPAVPSLAELIRAPASA